ncbi:MAG TPA: hypothetical protein VHY91_09970 [Pirellulales bacterium]|jgi:hypothetical protein|nr:hypothetical protein [Pirellulales bacterium]
MGIILPEKKEERKNAIVALVQGKKAEYKVGETTYIVEPRKQEKPEKSKSK